jgi:DNA-directed RNA polymerase subunit RPC12/RpoP
VNKLLKENGKSKRKTYLKCDNCKQKFELCEEEIVRLGDLKYIECVYCGTQHILKK